MIEVRIVEDSAGRAVARLVHGGLAEAIQRGLGEAAKIVGQRARANARTTIGNYRVLDSLAAPSLQRGGTEPTFVLGKRAPRWLGLHEYGGTIRARRAPFLVFESPRARATGTPSSR